MIGVNELASAHTRKIFTSWCMWITQVRKNSGVKANLSIHVLVLSSEELSYVVIQRKP